MQKNKEDDIRISPGAYVTVTDMGHLVEIQHMSRKNKECHIRKIDADRYVLLETGEIREFDKSENRAENENSLRKTFKRLRYLINNNFTGSGNELHLTLTYAENMMDTKRLYDDFRKFMQRLRYRLNLKTADLDYISVVEPQARGAWHMHVLLRFNDRDKVFIPSNDIAAIWGRGFVKIKAMKDIDNIGAYLSAYLADVSLDEIQNADDPDELLNLMGKEIVYKEIDGQRKGVVKGGRLWRYPVDMNLYRASRGIEMPERKEMPYQEIKKVVGDATPHYKKRYNLELEDFQNVITYEQYNLKR